MMRLPWWHSDIEQQVKEGTRLIPVHANDKTSREIDLYRRTAPVVLNQGAKFCLGHKPLQEVRSGHRKQREHELRLCGCAHALC
jgi:hypothetical protein